MSISWAQFLAPHLHKEREKMKTTLTTNYRHCRLGPHSDLFLVFSLLSLAATACQTVFAWKCLFKEFPVDVERIQGVWWVYGTNPEKTDRCFFNELDLYWTRITHTDYDNYAVELHCSLPWFRHQMAIYTREKLPSDKVIADVEQYLNSVFLSTKQFKLVDKETCNRNSKEPEQHWHLSKYMHLDYNPYYLKPLILDTTI